MCTKLPFPKRTLVLGGAASGKSDYSEQLVRSSGLDKSYIATAQAFDDEMRVKISKHQKDRGDDWLTTETPIDLPEHVLGQPAGNITLVDCLTLWLSNLMLSDADVSQFTKALLTVIDSRRDPIVFVSNEVGLGVVPDTPLGRQFREHQGRLNRQIAAKSDLVVLVTAGIPQVLKGSDPQVQP